MVYRKTLVGLVIATLAGCSAAEEDKTSSPEDRGVFERRNTAPDPADNALKPRRAEQAYARIALNCINKQYPSKISHVLNSAADVAEPAKLTPLFYGCFDWHSAVHGHWLLIRLWGQDLVPDMDDEIAAALAANYTAAKVAGELAYFQGADRTAFERPYGIAWFLQLTAELRDIAKGEGSKAEQAKLWLDRLQPLEALIVDNIKNWLPKLAYPVRLGTHNQSAFAFGLFLDWAARSGDREMTALVREKALDFHRQDRDCPMAYEPSGEDFLSSCLMVADLMRRLMNQREYAEWLSGFLPALPTDGRGDWLEMGVVKDPTDGKLVHLDGLNLSRAWALEGMASALPDDDPRRAALLASARLHGNSGEQAVRTPHYSGSHWLASFATYWRTRRGIDKNSSNPAS
ncbi:DUF2891 domain-containing protein [Sphingorhabdus sp. 109]|jgi:hypothetical protein|uniref:DUF2891 domain-containing protein n=1 Tax=Sphingorhabdus sp. 109 TaxID=2653173 RepID=UPI0012F3FCAA|nr:DUF2891 domain-containing protein [Sphingorhabdus sp. 109]VWX59634.1 conserved exported hypothetical protein [Sphingorhabdus sp. 109]